MLFLVTSLQENHRQIKQENEDAETQRLVFEKDFQTYKNHVDLHFMKVEQDISTLNQKTEHQKQGTRELQNMVTTRIENKIFGFEHQLMSFVNKSEMTKLWDFARGFAHKQMIDEFKRKIEPKMAMCEKTILEYRSDNEQMKECVMIMDREMCNKVNKVSFMELENRVEEIEKFNQTEVPMVKRVAENCESKIDVEMVQLRGIVSDLDRSLNASINTLVNDIVNKRLKQYDTVTKDFELFFNDQSLKEQFDTKVNKNYFEKVSATKATIEDIDGVKALILNLSNQIKQVSILQAEIAKSGIPAMASSNFKAQEGLNATIYKRDYLARQAEITSNWIIDTTNQQQDVNPVTFSKLRSQRRLLKSNHKPSLSGPRNT